MSDLDDLLIEAKCGGRIPEFVPPPARPAPPTPEESALMRRSWQGNQWRPTWLHLGGKPDATKLLEGL